MVALYGEHEDTSICHRSSGPHSRATKLMIRSTIKSKLVIEENQFPQGDKGSSEWVVLAAKNSFKASKPCLC